VGRGAVLALQSAQSPQLSPGQGMGRRGARLGPAHVQDAHLEIDLFPAQVRQLGRPEAVAEGQEDHGCVPVARGRLDQPLDLARGEVLPGPVLSVRTAPRHANCRIFAGWRDQFQVRF